MRLRRGVRQTEDSSPRLVTVSLQTAVEDRRRREKRSQWHRRCSSVVVDEGQLKESCCDGRWSCAGWMELDWIGEDRGVEAELAASVKWSLAALGWAGLVWSTAGWVYFCVRCGTMQCRQYNLLVGGEKNVGCYEYDDEKWEMCFVILSGLEFLHTHILRYGSCRQRAINDEAVSVYGSPNSLPWLPPLLLDCDRLKPRAGERQNGLKMVQ
ncbi:uncharacterized protein LY89DRAFT_394314 [Mollisia scopiformis]|uniref:Uncharacterized protein n=1 Tax=Mollisia scopiformis TaxID=149040 RepID=A0A194XQV4_MOLSC|nr:uncharacterized protein LY89DRAFT_394314 [Mollisia scopiformis]KUJ22107.1 hypothetical protein LY89DRAFT_394314 [Mollisia scopiformis]